MAKIALDEQWRCALAEAAVAAKEAGREEVKVNSHACAPRIDRRSPLQDLDVSKQFFFVRILYDFFIQQLLLLPGGTRFVLTI